MVCVVCVGLCEVCTRCVKSGRREALTLIKMEDVLKHRHHGNDCCVRPVKGACVWKVRVDVCVFVCVAGARGCACLGVS